MEMNDKLDRVNEGDRDADHYTLGPDRINVRSSGPQDSCTSVSAFEDQLK